MLLLAEMLVLICYNSRKDLSASNVSTALLFKFNICLKCLECSFKTKSVIMSLACQLRA